MELQQILKVELVRPALKIAKIAQMQQLAIYVFPVIIYYLEIFVSKIVGMDFVFILQKKNYDVNKFN